jgi:hypothetical protein
MHTSVTATAGVSHDTTQTAKSSPRQNRPSQKKWDFGRNTAGSDAGEHRRRPVAGNRPEIQAEPAVLNPEKLNFVTKLPTAQLLHAPGTPEAFDLGGLRPRIQRDSGLYDEQSS